MIFIRQSYDEDPNEFQLSDTDLQSGPPDLHKCPSWRIIIKFLLRKQTKETKTRQKRFFAFMLSVLICCLPTATVLAADTYREDNGQITNNLIVKWYDNLVFISDGQMTYKAPNGTQISDFHYYRDVPAIIQPDTTAYSDYDWKITITSKDADNNIKSCDLTAVKTGPEDKPTQPVKEEKSEDTSERKHDDQTPASWEANPNEISAFYIKNGFIDNRTKLGKEEQGETCQFIFRSSFPAGNNYKEAFSLSMSYDGKHTTDLKDGTLLLYIPPNLQRSGRKFKMLAINKDGEVFLYDNTSDNEGIFQTKLNVEGYAFCLIYTDEFILN